MEGGQDALPTEVGHLLATAPTHFVDQSWPLSRARTSRGTVCGLMAGRMVMRTEGKAPRPCRSEGAQGHRPGQGVRRVGAAAWKRSS